LEEQYQALSETLGTLISDIDTAMHATIRQTNSQFLSATIGIGVVGLLVVTVWGWYLMRSIADPTKYGH
jgi:hypothetical protein